MATAPNSPVPHVSRLAVVSVLISAGSVLAAILSWACIIVTDACLILPLMAIGIVAGIVSLVRISRSRGRLTGRLIGWLGVLIVPLNIVMVMAPPYLGFHPHNGRQPGCKGNLKQLALSFAMYSQDYDGALPPSERWSEALRPYMISPKILFCPSAKENLPSYGMNSNAKHIDWNSKEMSKYVLLADSKPGLNVHGGPEILPEKPRHTDGDNYAFTDGHVKWVKRGEATKLRWRVKNANSTVK